MGIRDDIRKMFEGMTTDQVYYALKTAGFNVSKGNGNIIIREEIKMPEKFKNKYHALNYLNEKYDVVFFEITDYQEVNEFANAFNSLYGRVDKDDYELYQAVMNAF